MSNGSATDKIKTAAEKVAEAAASVESAAETVKTAFAPVVPSPPDGTPDEYELKLDEQVGHFLGLKHSVTYFTITAAVGTFGFTINLLLTNKLLSASDTFGLILIGSAAFASLFGAGSALGALYLDIHSYYLHLKYRHERKGYSNLPKEEQTAWEDVNKWARRARVIAFISLFTTVSIQFFLILFLFVQKDQTASTPSLFSMILR